MKRIYLYQLNSSARSLVVVMLAMLTVCVPLVVNGLTIGDSPGHFDRRLAALQAVLLIAWTIQSLYLPYVVSDFVCMSQSGGLLEWWIAAGTSPWKIAMAQSLAIQTCLAAYIILIVTPLSIGLCWGPNIPWKQLGENVFLFLLTGQLLAAATCVIASRTNLLIGFLVGAGSWWLAVGAGTWMPEYLNHLPPILRPLGDWIWYTLPRFELLHRPMAIIYRWPPLAANLWLALVGYSGSCLVVLMIGCECAYRPRYVR